MLFFFPLYYQFYKVPPTYPIKYANWVGDRLDRSLGVIAHDRLVAIARPEKLKDMDRVYVEERDDRAGGAAAA